MHSIRHYAYYFVDANIREKSIDGMLAERCDGNRNIIHTCVAMCAPLSNRDNETGI